MDTALRDQPARQLAADRSDDEALFADGFDDAIIRRGRTLLLPCAGGL